jgi:hypothetical protein
LPAAAVRERRTLSVLPVAAAVAAAVKAASAVEPAATMKRGSAVESATLESTAVEAGIAMESAFTVPSTGTEVVPSTIVAAAIESTPAVETVEPGARADKHSPGKIIRTVIAVGRASIRGVPVISVGADRSRPHVGRPLVTRPHPNSNSNAYLSVSSPRARQRHKNSKQYSIL